MPGNLKLFDNVPVALSSAEVFAFNLYSVITSIYDLVLYAFEHKITFL